MKSEPSSLSVLLHVKEQINDLKSSPITIISKGEEDYISLSDMVKLFDEGTVLIEKWLRNKNTIEFIGISEQLNNQDFNSPEFGGIMSEAGLNHPGAIRTVETTQWHRHYTNEVVARKSKFEEAEMKRYVQFFLNNTVTQPLVPVVFQNK